MAGLCFLFFCSCFIPPPSPPIRLGEAFSSVIFSSLSLILFVFLDVAMVWKGKPASVTTDSRDRTYLRAEIIIMIIIITIIIIIYFSSNRTTKVLGNLLFENNYTSLEFGPDLKMFRGHSHQGKLLMCTSILCEEHNDNNITNIKGPYY